MEKVIVVEEVIVLNEVTRGVGDKRCEWKKKDGM